MIHRFQWTDRALRVHGDDLGDLCGALAWAICDQLCDIAAVAPRLGVEIVVDAVDRQSLVLALANQLLERSAGDGLLLPELRVRALGDGFLRAEARGEPSGPQHRLRSGPKAARLDELSLANTSKGLELFMLFDV